jgi:hypothetical protein
MFGLFYATKKHPSFTSLRKFFSKTLLEIKENRQASKIEHTLHDSVMAGYACMFLQCPSLMEYQRRLEKYTNRNNLKTQLNVYTTPSDPVIRNVIDSVSTKIFAKVFKEYLTRLQRGKHLIKYEFYLTYIYCQLMVPSILALKIFPAGIV